MKIFQERINQNLENIKSYATFNVFFFDIDSHFFNIVLFRKYNFISNKAERWLPVEITWFATISNSLNFL